MSRSKAASTNLNATHILRLSTSDISTTSQKTDLNLEVQKFWDFDSTGIRHTESLEEQFERNINFHYRNCTVSLSFRDENPTLSNNYCITANRQNTLAKRLRRDPDTVKECDKIIAEQLDKGIIENVDMNKPVDEGRVFFSPHPPVIRNDAITTKFRVVYDDSWEVNGISSNDIVLKGTSIRMEGSSWMHCWKFEGRCYRLPPFAGLPSFRLEERFHF